MVKLLLITMSTRTTLSYFCFVCHQPYTSKKSLTLHLNQSWFCNETIIQKKLDDVYSDEILSTSNHCLDTESISIPHNDSFTDTLVQENYNNNSSTTTSENQNDVIDNKEEM